MHPFRAQLEKAVKSFGFSAFCCLVWGSLTVLRARGLLERFSLMELAWLLNSATIAVLFLVRSRPTLVSLNPMHWLVLNTETGACETSLDSGHVRMP